MIDYHNLYLNCDVLADVFKKFRNNSIKNYGLCPGAPSLSWDAMLNMTKARKLIAKLAISIWNLITQNKNQNIIYLDANNLCGYAMP